MAERCFNNNTVDVLLCKELFETDFSYNLSITSYMSDIFIVSRWKSLRQGGGGGIHGVSYVKLFRSTSEYENVTLQTRAHT